MAVLLKNLVARKPRMEDLSAVSELIIAGNGSEYGMVDSMLDDLLSRWQRPDFNLAKDAWVIVTTRRQVVGFASVCCEDAGLISLLLCVHWEYRHRGIGTLLLRLAEVRAREYARSVHSDLRVALRSTICVIGEGTCNLFEREGYSLVRQFLRVAFSLAEDTSPLPVSEAQQKLRADISLEQGRLLGATPLYDRDGLCTVLPYRTYEKELRSASVSRGDPENGLNTLLNTF